MRQRDEALTSEDLSVCDKVLKAAVEKHAIDDEKGKLHLAAIVIEIYRQGVRSPEQLALLADASCEAMLDMRGPGPTLDDPAPI
ncbi:hypothetical protein [Rhizobium mesoamericanum]|uniref:hypothetical protein n=1 Tax=Rhizobium mesoamericanum TaxID=1079800 RepID=UPI000405C414|nr:hypothetical protein [Rhizobium mesoamericanum]